MNNLPDQLRTYIGNGKSADAIGLLLKGSEKYPDITAQVLMQSAKLKDLAKKEMMGVISFDDAMMVRNQVNYALLGLTDHLEPLLKDSEKKKVFISYNHADALTANKIKEQLNDAGLEVTIDSDAMSAGEDIKTFIEKCIMETDVTLSVISNESLMSAWVAMETINTFYHEKSVTPKKFIPCYIDPDFFDQRFMDDAVKTIDQKIEDANAVMSKRIEQRSGTDDIVDERQRLLDLKHYLDRIIGRLRNSLCIDVREANFENGIKKIIETIKN